MEHTAKTNYLDIIAEAVMRPLWTKLLAGLSLINIASAGYLLLYDVWGPTPPAWLPAVLGVGGCLLALYHYRHIQNRDSPDKWE